VVLDVAHNPDGAQRLLMKARTVYPGSRFCILLAVSKDKDVQKIVSAMCEEAIVIVCTEAQSDRAMSSHALANIVRAKNSAVAVREVSDPKQALAVALACAAEENCPLLVTGTFFLMSAVRLALGFEEVVDF
jgi:folylpolyglutamate synthase/dihydropteroate synthase